MSNSSIIGIEPALRQQLSAELHTNLTELAEQLANAVRAYRSGEEIPSISVPLSIVQELVGKQIESSDTLLNFGQGNQFGDIQTGDIAGRDIININLGVQQSSVIDRPFLAPRLPDYFVVRPEISALIKSRLLSELNGSVTSGVVAIHGMGGSGKSTLATSLAYDSEIQNYFSDGIFWATLGQQPDLLALLNVWVGQLGGAENVNIEIASARLHSLLQNKATLLIIDDAWSLGHVRPFLVASPRSRILITTRDVSIAQDAGVVRSNLFVLDEMTQEQSVALLAGRLGRSLEIAEQAQALKLAEVVGYLPLALELAAIQVSDGFGWEALAKDLQTEIAHLEGLDVPGVEEDADIATARQRSLLGSLYLSLRRLPDDKRQQFAWLGILAEDASLSPAMAATLWETDIRTAQNVLRYLQYKALLVAEALLLNKPPTYRLHDLLRDMARRLLVAPVVPNRSRDIAGLGVALLEAQSILLARYRKQTRDGKWSTLPDDRYIYTNLTWHMEQVGCIDEIHKLLSEETDEGKNAWYQAREQLGQTAGYITDVMRAWHLADEAFIRSQIPSELGFQCRYALITVSLNSLANNIPVALLGALVNNGVWTTSQGLQFVRQIPEHEQRAKALISFSATLTEPIHQQEALAIIQSIEDEDSRRTALKGLVLRFSAPLLQKALQIAQNISDSEIRASVLTTLLPYLPEPQQRVVRQQVLELAEALDYAADRAWLLINLLPQLEAADRSAVVQHALATAEEINDAGSWANVLSALAPYLETSERATVIEQALTAIPTITDIADRGRASVTWVLRLAEMGDLAQALSLAQSIEDAFEQAKAFAELAPSLPTPLLPEALAAAQAMQRTLRTDEPLVEQLYERNGRRYVFLEGQEWVVGLIALAHYLPEPERAVAQYQAMTAARAIESPITRSWLLAQIAPIAEEAQRDGIIRDILAALQSIEDAGYRAWLLPTLASALVVEEWDKIVHDTVTAAQAIEDVDKRIWALLDLVALLAEPERSQVLYDTLPWARSMTNSTARANALTELIAYVAESERGSVISDILSAASAIENSAERTSVLTSTAVRLAEFGYFSEALEVSRKVEDQDRRSSVLAALVPLLPKAQQLSAAHDVLPFARTITDQGLRAQILTALVPCVSAQERDNVLHDALRSTRLSRQVSLLTALIPFLTEPDQRGVAHEVLVVARAIEDTAARSRVLADLALCLADTGYLSDALAVVDGVESIEIYIATIAELAPVVPAALLTDVLPGVQALSRQRRETNKITQHYSEARGKRYVVQAGWEWVAALIGMAPYLQEAQRTEVVREALDAARRMSGEYARAWALTHLVPYVPATERQDVLQEAQEVIRSIEARNVRIDSPDSSDVDDWANALVDLCMVLAEDERMGILKEALLAVQLIGDTYDQAETTMQLLLRVAESGHLDTALSIARTIVVQSRRAQALTALAPRLLDSERDDLVHEALVAARASKYEYERTRALAVVAPLLQDEEREAVVQEALAIADPGGLIILAPLSTERDDVIRDALTRAQALDDVDSRSDMLADLALLLADAGYASDALACTALVENVRQRAKTLAEVAPCLPASLIPEALSLARAMRPPDRVPTRITEVTPDVQAERIVVQEGCEWVVALIGLLPHLSTPERIAAVHEGLRSAQTIADQAARVWALIKLIPSLPDLERAGTLRNAVALARSISDPYIRVLALLDTLPLLSEVDRLEVAHEALALAQQLQNDNERMWALCALLRLRSIEEQNQVVADAWATARRIADYSARATALVEIAPYIPATDWATLVMEMLAATEAVIDIDDRVWGRADVAIRLAEFGQFAPALSVLNAIERLDVRLQVLGALLSLLPEGKQRSAAHDLLPTVRSNSDSALRTGVMVQLIPHLLPDEQAVVVAEVLQAVRTIQDDSKQISTLLKLIPWLSEIDRNNLVQDLLEACRSLTDNKARIDTLVKLFPYLFAEEQQAAIHEILSVLETVEDMVERAEQTADAAVQIAVSGYLHDALAMASSIEIPLVRSSTLATLAPYLAEVESLLAEALRMTWLMRRELQDQGVHTDISDVRGKIYIMQDGWEWVVALIGLIPVVPEDEQVDIAHEALAALQNIESEKASIWALAQLMPQLSETERRGLAQDALVMVEGIEENVARANCLAMLAPYLAEPERSNVLENARSIALATRDMGERWEVLAVLAEQLLEAGHIKEAIKASGMIEYEVLRSRTLAKLASHIANASAPASSLYWNETIRLLATRTRKDLLIDLSALSSVVSTLGGAQGILNISCAIQDIGRWWS